MSEPIDLKHTRDLAATWVRAAGHHARAQFGAELAVSFKADSSLITEVDLEVQARLVTAISDAFPEHVVLGEEELEDHAPTSFRGRYTWLIDPVDGTRNYVHGFPCFSTAVALFDRDRPVLGLVYDPISEHFFDAYEGGGTRLNGAVMRADRNRGLRDLLIGFPGGRNLSIPAALFDIFGRRTNLRNLGSTCLHMALVASGSLDAAYGRKAKLWDVAAGFVLGRESGAVVTADSGEPLFPLDPTTYQDGEMPFVAARPDLHDDILRAVEMTTHRT